MLLLFRIKIFVLINYNNILENCVNVFAYLCGSPITGLSNAKYDTKTPVTKQYDFT